MIREFSEEKRDEIYAILATIDDSPCCSFSEWCGNCWYEFGDWMERLCIPDYMGKIGRYEMRIKEMNASLRRQIDTVFSNVYDIDRKYGAIFRSYVGIVAGQKQIIDDMRAVLSSRSDSSERGSTEDSQTYMLMCEMIDENAAMLAEKEKRGEDLLDKCLQANGYTNSAERQRIIDLTREKRPELLSNLYITDSYSSATRDSIYEQILLYYSQHKNDKKLEAAEAILRNYLTEQGIDSTKQQEFIDTIRETEPSMLLNVYITDCYSSEDTEAVLRAIMNRYNQSNQYYMGKYRYPAAYIEGILMTYEAHIMVDGRFVLDNGGRTIGYGHDLVDGEDFSDGLSVEEALELAIADLDTKYDDILLCIDQINDLSDRNISIDDFSENEIMFFWILRITGEKDWWTDLKFRRDSRVHLWLC